MFYYLVENDRVLEAEDLYRGRFPFHKIQDATENYEILKANEKSDKKFRLILVGVFVIVLGLVFWAIS